MKHKTTLFIGLSVFISIAVVLVLYLGSSKKPNYQYASFERRFVHDAIHLDDTFNMKYFNYYLAGKTSSTIFLGNSELPSHLVSINTTFTDTTHYKLRVDNDSLKYNSLKVSVDSPYFFMEDGTRPFIYKGELRNKIASIFFDDIYFKTSTPLSATSVAIVALDQKENTLGKKTIGVQKPEIFRDLLEEQGEGIFSTDGILLHNKESSKLVYLYFYRNQYIVMDTSFNLEFKGNTIDTIAHAKIKVGEFNSGTTYTMAAPPLKVNNRAAVCGQYLYINSNLLGKNEDKKIFETNAVIDVYNLKTKKYEYSFYLPAFKGRELNQFLVLSNTTIIAQYEPFLVKYMIRNYNEDL